jgi:hypothetical protein
VELPRNGNEDESKSATINSVFGKGDDVCFNVFAVDVDAVRIESTHKHVVSRYVDIVAFRPVILFPIAGACSLWWSVRSVRRVVATASGGIGQNRFPHGTGAEPQS